MSCYSTHSLMWVFVSEWTVLNTFLDFASEVASLLFPFFIMAVFVCVIFAFPFSSYLYLPLKCYRSTCSYLSTYNDHQECSFTGANGGRCDRTLLIERMMNYAGFDSDDIYGNINNADFNNFTMVSWCLLTC